MAMGKRRSVAETGLRITFDGPGLADHTVNARELGRTLVSLSDAFTTAYGLIGDKEMPSPSLTIRETGPGSFWVDLSLIVDHTIIQTTIDVLTSKYADAAFALSTVVGGAVGAIVFIKRRGGRAVSRVEEPRPDVVRVVYADGSHDEVPAAVWLIAKSPAFQKSAKESVRAVTSKGIDTLRIETDVPELAPIVEVATADYSSFQVNDDGEEIPEPAQYELIVGPSSVGFKDGLKWRFNDGEKTFSATMSDEKFLADLDENRVQIGKNDQFKVLLRQEQSLEKGKLRTDYTVLQVLRHMKPGVQGQFQFETPEAETSAGERGGRYDPEVQLPEDVSPVDSRAGEDDNL